MANDHLDSGRDPNEEEPFQVLFRRAENGKNCVDKRPSICMVPSVLRDLSEKSFIPRVVSIGPLHKENENLQEFEWLKDSYLHALLSHSGDRTRTLEECLKKVSDLMEDIRSSYDVRMIKKYKDTELANMMVLDASFILEFCFKQDNKELLFKKKKKDNKEPTLLSKIQITWIAIDLMLLENQIPFTVLQAIFDCTIKKSHPKISLTFLLRTILGTHIHPFCISLDIKVTNDSTDSKHVHVLDCVHKLYKVKPSEKAGDGQPSEMVVEVDQPAENVGDGQPSQKDGEVQPAEKDGDCQTLLNYNHSVVELDRSGVNFKPQKEKEMAMSMNIEKSRSWFLSPWRKRTLVMPTLVIQEFTETVLRNFIAYEQFSPQVDYYFTSYASAMDMLIDCEKDVRKLVKSKVIVNNLGSNKAVAKVINGICVNIEIERFCYSEAIQELDTYYNSYWPKHYADLKRTYFHNPWVVIALIAAFIVFGLQILQAVLRIKGK